LLQLTQIFEILIGENKEKSAVLKDKLDGNSVNNSALAAIQKGKPINSENLVVDAMCSGIHTFQKKRKIFTMLFLC
jgi:hypothetical protein